MQEEAYCQLRAQGETRRTAWKRAFGTENVNDATLDTRVSRLEKRPDILARIDEIKRFVIEENAAKWEKRREELLDLLYAGAIAAAGDPKQGGIMATCKTVGQLANILGWNGAQRVELSATGSAIDTKTIESKVDKLLELAAK